MNLSCTICRSDYQEDDSVLELPCSHLFHPPCITTWLKLVKYLFTFTVTTNYFLYLPDNYSKKINRFLTYRTVADPDLLSLTLPAFLPTAILFFFFFFYPKKKGGEPVSGEYILSNSYRGGCYSEEYCVFSFWKLDSFNPYYDNDKKKQQY